MSKKSLNKNIQIDKLLDSLHLPDWDNFLPKEAVRDLRKLYAQERELIERSSLSRISFSKILQIRAPIRKKVIELLGMIYHLDRVGRIEYPGISKVTQKASVLVEEHSQYLEHYSQYPKMITRLAKSPTVSSLSAIERWYLSREDREVRTEHYKEGSLRELLSLRSKLNKLERVYMEKGDESMVVEMIKLRHKIANLSGFSSWNEKSLSGLMMSSIGVDGVSNLLLDLKIRVVNIDTQRYVNYRTPMFAPRYTIDGILDAAKEILHAHFGLILSLREVSVWADGVIYFDVYTRGNTLLGGIYLDLFSRKGKVEGAWSGVVRDGEKDILPLSMVVTNFTFGKNISHYEFVTFIHEFGHAVHYIFSRPEVYLGYVRYLEDDAIEVMGRFFERFAYDAHIVRIALLGRRKKLTDKDMLFIKKLKEIQSAFLFQDRVRDIAVSLYDWDIHLRPPEDLSELHARWSDISEHVIRTNKKEGTIFPPVLQYVFGGTYSAKFVIYIWADVIAAQLYNKYIKLYKVSPKKAMASLRRILAQGSTRPMVQILRPLLGSKVRIAAYLSEMIER